MLALPLRLPTAPYGGHMGHFLLSTLALMGSTPFGNRESPCESGTAGRKCLGSLGELVCLWWLVCLQPVRPGSRPNEAFERGVGASWSVLIYLQL